MKQRIYIDTSVIGAKLFSPLMTEEEALDALTGNFEKQKNWCEQLYSQRMENSNNERQFFSELLNDTNKAFQQSKISEHKQNEFLHWGYSVTATQIMKNKPLIVGFNWGVDKEWLKENIEKNKRGYGVQKLNNYPFRTFESNYDDLGSFKRTIPYFHEYFPKALSGMQTNFCFFRSEKESDIESRDLQLSSALFDKFLIYSIPSILISFSKTLFNYLDESDRLLKGTKDICEIKSGNRTIYSVRAKLQYCNEKTVGFIYLPHPNYPITKKARDKAWEFIFKNEY